MDRATLGGWVYIMTDRYRGTLYVGVTSDIATRVSQHREDIGSDFCKRYGLHRLVWAERFDTIDEAITFEKRIKRCLLYTSPSPRDRQKSRMPSSA